MRKILCSALFVIFMASFSHAQQDPMFTKYMFNTLIYNPAYAGTKDHLSIGLLHRDQWVKLEGAPTTQTLTVHTPLLVHLYKLTYKSRFLKGFFYQYVFSRPSQN